MASMIDHLDGIDTSEMTIHEIFDMLAMDFGVKSKSFKSLYKIMSNRGMKFKRENVSKFDFEGIYIKGMPVAELAKAAGSSYPTAKDWVSSRVSIPTDGVAHLVLHCKWGCNDNNKVKNQ